MLIRAFALRGEPGARIVARLGMTASPSTLLRLIRRTASIEARVRLMLQTVLEGGAWSADRADLDAYNERCVAERRSWSAEAVVAELRETGRETAKLFGPLTADELDREWEHPIFGPMTIERTAGIVARHLRSHAEELRSALQQ